MTIREIFLENLELEMSKRNITFYKMSSDLNIPYSTFSGWKNRDATPKIDKLVEVSQYLDVPSDKLLGLPEKDPPKFSEDEIFLIECYRRADTGGRESIRRFAEFEGNGKSSTFQEDKLLAKKQKVL